MRLYRERILWFNGETVLIQDVVRLFLRILKIECLDFEKNRQKGCVGRRIQWGLTIPTIWGDRNDKVMTAVASEVFGEARHIGVLTEPEGPVLSGLVHSTGRCNFDPNTVKIKNFYEEQIKVLIKNIFISSIHRAT